MILGSVKQFSVRIARQLDHSPPYPKSAICQFRTLTALTWHGNQHSILSARTSDFAQHHQRSGAVPRHCTIPKWWFCSRSRHFSIFTSGKRTCPIFRHIKKTKNSCELQQPLVKSPKSFLVKPRNFPVKAPQKPSSARSLADQASLGRSSRNWGRRWSWRSIFTWGKQGNNAKDVPSIDPKT